MDIQKEKLDMIVTQYRHKGYDVFGVYGDVTNRQELEQMFQEAMILLQGKLDVLIPAAGVQRRHLPESFPLKDFDLIMKVNLDHVYIMIQKALQVMLSQASGGKIITVGSMVSWFGGTNVSAYTASSASDYINGAVIPVDGAYLVK